MNIKFTIPDPQPIEIEIDRNWFTGNFTCTANGEKRNIKNPGDLGTHFSFSTSNTYTLEVGYTTKHVIEIEHTRPRWFGGLRPNRYVVKVDGNVVADETGY